MYRFLLVTLFSLVVLSSGFSQKPVDRKTAPRSAQKQYEKGMDALRERNPEKAIKYFEKAIDKAPGFTDAWSRRGLLLYEEGAWSEAEKCFETLYDLDPDFQDRLLYRLALTEWKQGKYEEAEAHLDIFLKSTPEGELDDRTMRHIRNLRFASEAMRNPVPFQPEILPESVNSAAMEYLPMITADGSLLIFTRRSRRNEDFYFCRKIDGRWTPAQPISEINTLDNEGAQTLSADGQTLLFTACNRREDYGSCDLYMAYRQKGGWSTPFNIGPPINTSAWESEPALSQDGKTLYFASNRPGGLGGSDIWMSKLQENGRWGQPVNLGSPINTPFDEESPFLHYDLQTLYFMSDGHPGMGGYDLYLSRKDSTGEWQTPENLGYPINTTANEGALFVSLDGQTAYFASDQKEYRPSGKGGSIDIYTFQLPPNKRAAPSTFVETYITDAETGLPLKATLKFLVLPNGSTLLENRANSDGYYLACLPAIGDFMLHIDHPGYIFHSEHFALNRPDSIKTPYRLEIALQSIPEMDTTMVVRKPMVLRNIFFETGSAKLRPVSHFELDRLYKLLQDSPGMRIRINGHTDHVGSEKDNQRLSEARAKAVYEYLIDKGIESTRLEYKGFGEMKPIADNDTAEGRQKNRRTEFEII